MPSAVVVDEGTGRKFTLDEPEDLRPDEEVLFLLNLHGGGSVGQWQHEYFPAYRYAEQFRLVVATPSAATKEPSRHWVLEADEEHLRNIVDLVFERYGRKRVRSFWLVGHSQGGRTANILLNRSDFFKQRVDGWLSLSGGRIGPHERPAEFFHRPGEERREPLPHEPAPMDVEMSFIFAVGAHEITELPRTSPWAEKYGARARVRLDDVIDEEPGLIWDHLRERSNRAWGLQAAPGRAEVYVYPDARDGRVIADIVRVNKGHTEGLEPRITETILQMIAGAPGGKARSLAAG